MTDIAASATANTGGGVSDVRANAALESVDVDTRVAVTEHLLLGGGETDVLSRFYNAYFVPHICG
jgi:hypothetical protein